MMMMMMFLSNTTLAVCNFTLTRFGHFYWQRRLQKSLFCVCVSCSWSEFVKIKLSKLKIVYRQWIIQKWICESVHCHGMNGLFMIQLNDFNKSIKIVISSAKSFHFFFGVFKINQQEWNCVLLHSTIDPHSSAAFNLILIIVAYIIYILLKKKCLIFGWKVL